ncbi:MAG: DUF4157 domain-containing protein [Cyanomargarita calcarea GSE-NOS-MK-12-04C]|jgi:hypothetical protein|uniref:DUF4157 domain-containing protein n=1 Tax=Cyanomargarita calcarea GSE-NOS-MK-12-04C TaxID=2839659 RepID=A0A951UVW4_9CYAN|nr:DUF4157 domain-containing protein [Cyanomargarita calcarea GSE-NOS-MK-12-04C]
MKTPAVKEPSNTQQRQALVNRAVIQPSRRSLSSGVLQRKPSCACGGGCPRCQTKLNISEPGDKYEQEAERIADEVMRMPEPSVQRQMEPKEEGVIQTKAINSQVASSVPIQESSEVPPIVQEVLNSPGQPLDLETRTFMESRFGHDFSQVRVHTDEKAVESAKTVKALAYTVGHNVVFGAGQYLPKTVSGRGLLAHELTHVLQQQPNTRHMKVNNFGFTKSPAHIQQKLALTGTQGDVARVIAIINAGIDIRFQARMSASGEVEIIQSGNQGPPTPEQQFFTGRLQSLINEAGTTTVSVVSGGTSIVGSYALSQIDIADIEALGIGQPGWDARAALLHELVEQREKQLGTTAAQRAYGSPTSGSHGQGLAAELGMIGAVLESDTNLVGATANPDGTMNGTRTVIFRYPDGTRYRVTVTLSHNNITNVTRTRLP